MNKLFFSLLLFVLCGCSDKQIVNKNTEPLYAVDIWWGTQGSWSNIETFHGISQRKIELLKSATIYNAYGLNNWWAPNDEDGTIINLSRALEYKIYKE